VKLFALAALLALPAIVSPVHAEPSPAQVRNGSTVPLSIRTPHRTVRFRVEVARTPDEQELGLMYRKAMPADHGMIFPMDPPRRASFWMRNTLIPLDMVFIRADGTISSIIANVPPLTLATRDSTEPVAAVLELNGGAAARAGIKAGDRVKW